MFDVFRHVGDLHILVFNRIPLSLQHGQCTVHPGFCLLKRALRGRLQKIFAFVQQRMGHLKIHHRQQNRHSDHHTAHNGKHKLPGNAKSFSNHSGPPFVFSVWIHLMYSLRIFIFHNPSGYFPFMENKGNFL